MSGDGSGLLIAFGRERRRRSRERYRRTYSVVREVYVDNVEDTVTRFAFGREEASIAHAEGTGGHAALPREEALTMRQVHGTTYCGVREEALFTQNVKVARAALSERRR